MDLQIAGKRALVLGGSRGLGRAVADALADEGVHVALIARDAAALAHAVEQIEARGRGRAVGLSADLSDWAAMDAVLAEVPQRLGGPVEILLNNSGGPPAGPVSGIDAELWRRHFETMILSYIRTADWALPAMRSAGWGRILNIASMSVIQPIPQLGMSNTLRAAIVGWAKTLSHEVAADGITVNTLLPGRIDTDRIAMLDAGAAEAQGLSVEAVREMRTRQIPVGRSGSTREFGATAAFLASPLAAYITGSTIRLDGGAILSV